MKFKELMEYRISMGVCCYCGDEPIVGKRAGAKCLAKRAAERRRRKGYKPQEETGRGRPKFQPEN